MNWLDFLNLLLVIALGCAVARMVKVVDDLKDQIYEGSVALDDVYFAVFPTEETWEIARTYREKTQLLIDALRASGGEDVKSH